MFNINIDSQEMKIFVIVYENESGVHEATLTLSHGDWKLTPRKNSLITKWVASGKIEWTSALQRALSALDMTS